MVLTLPQGNQVAKFGKDPIYRTKVTVRKPVWTPESPVRHTQSHNTTRLETGVNKKEELSVWVMVRNVTLTGTSIIVC